MKIVINRCFGGFGLSEKVIELYNKYSGRDVDWHSDIDRNDPHLVRAVEELKEKSYGAFAELEVIEIPDDIKWHIHEYDGYETVHENHRSWPGGDNC